MRRGEEGGGMGVEDKSGQERGRAGKIAENGRGGQRRTRRDRRGG